MLTFSLKSDSLLFPAGHRLGWEVFFKLFAKCFCRLSYIFIVTVYPVIFADLALTNDYLYNQKLSPDSVYVSVCIDCHIGQRSSCSSSDFVQMCILLMLFISHCTC